MRLALGAITVRDFERKDAQLLCQIAHEKEIVRFMGDWAQNSPTPESLYGFIDWLQTKKICRRF